MNKMLVLLGTLETNGMDWSGVIGGMGQFLLVIIVFVFVLYIAYVTAKWIGSSKGFRRGTNIEVIESTSVGFQNTVCIVKTAGKYFLVGVTKENVTLLSELDGNQIIERPQNVPGPRNAIESYLVKLFKGKGKK